MVFGSAHREKTVLFAKTYGVLELQKHNNIVWSSLEELVLIKYIFYFKCKNGLI